MDADKRSGSLSIIMYPLNMMCETTIKTSCDKVVFRFYGRFGIEFTPSCAYDYVQVGSPVSAATDLLCGSSGYSSYHDYGNYYDYDLYDQDQYYPYDFMQWVVRVHEFLLRK